jgi:4-hydroxybenzoate polyprenyltransferase
VPHPVGRLLTFIRFSHTVFALPFALGSMLVASHDRPGWRLCGLILLCMVFARTAAMLFNRLADWEIDQRNPRTAGRHRLVAYPVAVGLLVASSVAFVATTFFINRLCFALSPVALLIIFFYSLTKRFTHYTQLFLGLALAVSPVGAWLAVRGRFDWPPLILAGAVLLWVAGFDLIYATMDHDFDLREGLRSLVVRFGIKMSLRLARALHAAALVGLAAFGVSAGLGWTYAAGLTLMLVAFVYEHRTVSAPGTLDVGLVNRAFFHANAFVGLVFVTTIWIDRAPL